MSIAYLYCPYASYAEVAFDSWWGGRDFWRVPLHHGPVRSLNKASARRSPARACRMDRARRKRRRFVQGLR